MARSPRAPKRSPAGKMLDVLWGIARRPNSPLVNLADELGLAPPTAHRITAELERLGYLQRVPGSRKLTVSTALVEFATDVLGAAAASAPLQALLHGLSEEIGEMCTLGVEVGDEIVYLASAEPRQQRMLVFRAGRRAPLFCTSSGRLYLAQLDRKSLERFLASSRRTSFTPHTVTDAKRLATEIERAGRQGYAVTNQEFVLHIVGAAVPVLDARGRMVAALSVAAPTVRLSLAGVRRLVPRLKTAANELGRLLGAESARVSGQPGPAWKRTAASEFGLRPRR